MAEQILGALALVHWFVYIQTIYLYTLASRQQQHCLVVLFLSYTATIKRWMILQSGKIAKLVFCLAFTIIFKSHLFSQIFNNKI